MNSDIITAIKGIISIIAIVVASLFGTFGVKNDPNIPPDDNYPLQQANEVADKNLLWPDKQLFPTFTKPEGDLIAFPTDLLSDSELVALSCLQGFVNAIGTKVVILDSDVSKWLHDYNYNYSTVSKENVYSYINELCSGAVAGVILYSTERSEHYLNLASSIGNTMNAIPLTAEDYELWKENGIHLPVIADIRGIKYTSAFDIYKYFFDHYWDDCNQKVLVVQRPDLKFQMRDLASSTGGAVVYLSCSGGTETWLFKKYLGTMTPGESILTGWYAGQERELMTVAAKCGLSCVPADFFSNPTVFAQNEEINVPAVPDVPKLQNKIYVAYFLSDGDNIQYDMHAMREYWDNNASNRGKVPVNWTISPALTDIAPRMMNYYYESATDSECFVCGPSGMGYTMPMNTFGSNKGNQFRSNKNFSAYVNMTNDYLQRSGLRVVTIWDNLSKSQRDIYTSEGTYLYGLTVHHFTNSSLKAKYTGVVNDTLIMQMTPSYFAQNAEGNLPHSELGGHIKEAVNYLKYNASSPVFVATQVSVWAFHNINDVVELENELSEYYANIYGEDVVEFVRADHFYNLYYQANNLPYDVTLNSALTATATSGSDKAILTTDGTCYGESLWTAEATGEQSVTYSLGETYSINEIALYHAETNGLDKALNTRDFKIEISEDAAIWKTVTTVTDNTDSWNDIKFTPTNGAYVRVTITDAGIDNIARIADIDIYGKLVK